MAGAAPQVRYGRRNAGRLSHIDETADFLALALITVSDAPQKDERRRPNSITRGALDMRWRFLGIRDTGRLTLG